MDFIRLFIRRPKRKDISYFDFLWYFKRLRKGQQLTALNELVEIYFEKEGEQ